MKSMTFTMRLSERTSARLRALAKYRGRPMAAVITHLVNREYRKVQTKLPVEPAPTQEEPCIKS